MVVASNGLSCLGCGPFSHRHHHHHHHAWEIARYIPRDSTKTISGGCSSTLLNKARKYSDPQAWGKMRHKLCQRKLPNQGLGSHCLEVEVSTRGQVIVTLDTYFSEGDESWNVL